MFSREEILTKDIVCPKVMSVNHKVMTVGNVCYQRYKNGIGNYQQLDESWSMTRPTWRSHAADKRE